MWKGNRDSPSTKKSAECDNVYDDEYLTSHFHQVDASPYKVKARLIEKCW